MTGGLGDDTYIVDLTEDVIAELGGGGSDTVQTIATFTLSGNIENLILGGALDINGTGSVDANKITGNGGKNLLSGLGGADTLLGGLGIDTLLGGDANDSVFGEGGTDSLQGEIGDDTLDGGDGNDTLGGGAGINQLFGGLGDDVYLLNSTSDVITENDTEGTDLVQTTLATTTLAKNVENLTLLTGAVTGNGNELKNFITGNDANNSLDGALSTDTMAGGKGNDVYTVDDTGDIVTELTGNGTDEIKAGVSISALASFVENLTLTGIEDLSGTGNTLANLIAGNSGANKIFGGDLNDTLTGNAGNDTLQGDAGTDSMAGGDGNDRYIVDATLDLISEIAGKGTDTVETTATYTLAGNIENLILAGTAAINGTGSIDANNILGNIANNILTGLGGADTLTGGGGLDTLFGGDANDWVLGEIGADNLLGEAGDDTLEGGDGNDTLAGGIGNNLLKGGDGDDTYIIDAVNDVIAEDFGKGIDTVLLEDVSFSLLTMTDVEIENLEITGTANINATGNNLANKITGNDGNNELRGGNGNDTLIGGLGDDVYFIEDTKDTGKDQVIEQAGEGSDTIQSAVSISLVGFSEIENIQLVQNGNINAVGSDTDNKITGNNGNNSLSGGNGNDTLIGDGIGGDNFADTLNGGAGNDTYFVEGNTDIVIDSGGVDTVISNKSSELSPRASRSA